MKKKILFLLFIFIVTLVVSISISAAELDFNVELTDGTKIQSTDNVVYLPSYADITKLKIGYSSAFLNMRINGVPVKNGDVINVSSLKKVNQVDRIEYYELKLKWGNAGTEQTILIYKASSLRSLFISTSIGKSSLLGDTEDKSAAVKLINKDSSVLLEKTASVKTRGNSTDTYMKKPFQVKFANGTDVLGMGKAKTWLLLADYLDQTYMRNALMYRLAKDLGMGACDFTSVDVFVDGEYQGVYLLCEKVNINANRVNISELEKQNDMLNPTYSKQTTTVIDSELINETIVTEYKYVNGVVNPSDITGGYLVELDNNSKENRSKFDSYFITQTEFGENLYVIQSPEKCSKEQVEYIARLFAEMEEAMAASDGINSLGKHYTSYIDMESFATAYIMAELGKNYDAGSASIYFNKDIDKGLEQSKIVKGPLWVCDNTLGNIHRNGAEHQESMWAKNRTPWNMLTRHSEFNFVVTNKFEQAYDIIYDMLDKGGFIDQQLSLLGCSPAMDRARWDSADPSAWPKYYDGSLHWFQQNGNAFPTYPVYTDYINATKLTAVGYLCNALAVRTNYLVSEWGCDVEKRTRVLNISPAPLDETVTDAPILPNQSQGGVTDTPPDENNGAQLTPEPSVPNGLGGDIIATIIALSVIGLGGILCIAIAILNFSRSIKRTKGTVVEAPTNTLVEVEQPQSITDTEQTPPSEPNDDK